MKKRYFVPIVGFTWFVFEQAGEEFGNKVKEVTILVPTILFSFLIKLIDSI